jgi:adenylate cyclase
MNTKKIAVGFADLSDYTQLLKTVGPEQAIAYLQAAFKATGDTIIKHGGKIHKYVGDAILFYFDDPRRAATAAREIVAGYERQIGKLVLRCAVGMAYGEVVFCKLGHPSRMVDDIIGEPVNEAALQLKQATSGETKLAFSPSMRPYVS